MQHQEVTHRVQWEYNELNLMQYKTMCNITLASVLATISSNVPVWNDSRMRCCCFLSCSLALESFSVHHKTTLMVTAPLSLDFTTFLLNNIKHNRCYDNKMTQEITHRWSITRDVVLATWHLNLYSSSTQVLFQSTCTCIPTCNLSTCTCTWGSGTCHFL